MGKWKPIGDPNHVIMGGLDGDKTACGLMKSKYVDATGVQDLYFEADALLKAIVGAVENGEKQPDAWIDDPGFALTQGNMAPAKTICGAASSSTASKSLRDSPFSPQEAGL